MAVRKLFGTDGIRARAGDFPLNVPAIAAIGQAIAEKLGGTVLVGEDTRISSPWIREILAAGFKAGAQETAVMEDAGVIPTPAVALLTRVSGYSGGVMISASHNPYEDNGIKVFSADGTKLDDAGEAELERRIFELLAADPAAERSSSVPDRYAFASNQSPWPARYQQELLSHFRGGRWLSGLRIVVDCANGAMSEAAPAMLRALGAQVEVHFAAPSGTNINAGCGAVHLEALTAAMARTKADFGVAFDGDGDRSLFVSSSGRRIDGDAVLLILSRRLRPRAVVGTSMTNYALEKKLEAEGIELARVGVGDRFIFEEMRRRTADGVLGGEPSGHIIFPDFGLSGDGLLTTLKLAEAMVDAGRGLDELARDWEAAPQSLKGVRVRERVPLERLGRLQETMKGAEEALRGCGRLVVRYSGTEPLLRVMIESDDAGRNAVWMDRLLAAIEMDFKERPAQKNL
jgi:phosphoglucosamine mutase